MNVSEWIRGCYTHEKPAQKHVNRSPTQDRDGIMNSFLIGKVEGGSKCLFPEFFQVIKGD